jgi:hypothetical protein
MSYRITTDMQPLMTIFVGILKLLNTHLEMPHVTVRLNFFLVLVGGQPHVHCTGNSISKGPHTRTGKLRSLSCVTSYLTDKLSKLCSSYR